MGKGSNKRETGPRFKFIVDRFLGETLDHYGNELQEAHGFIARWFFDQVFHEIAIPPEKLDKLKKFAAKGRLIYAIPYRSPLDFLFFNVRLRYPGLPVPEVYYNTNLYRFQPFRKVLKIGLARLIHLLSYGSWPDPFENKYYLKRFREGAGFVLALEDPATFIQRHAYPLHDPLYHLIKLHRKHGDTIIVIPIFPVFERSPDREDKRLWDIFFGPKDRPGRLRKIVHYLRYRDQAFVEVADPVTIDRFLQRPDQQGLTDEEIAFNLRKELWDHATREQKVIRGPRLKPRTQLMEAVLRDPEVLKVIRQESKNQGRPFREVRKKAARYIDEIAANYSQSTVEFLDRALTWAWQNLYDGVVVDEKGLDRVREAAKRYPVVYVPSHKSHIDYLVLSWVIYHHNMVPPHIVAGVNLNTWPIGTIFRKAGAFFMRRTFRGNELYAAVFSKYVEMLIREGYNIEFFIEGGRSRTGRLLLPKMGMVKYILEAYENRAARDIMFVPVYIGYDQIIEEGEYLEEMSGTKNPKGNLVELLRNRRLLRQRYGHIYINFARPISLREHVESMSDLDPALPEEEKKSLIIQKLAEEIIQGINRNQVVTPFSLMAAALLSSPARAISRSELLNALALYYQYLTEVQARFAETLEDFTKAMEDVIAYYRNRNLIEVEDEEDQEEPIYTLPEDQRLSLEMYKNMIIHHFLPIVFVSLSLLSADYGECSESKLKEDYRFLKELFRFEFVYDQRKTDEEYLDLCLEFLSRGRHITIRNLDGTRLYQVTPKGREEMVFFSAMLTNFLEAYAVVFNTLPRLKEKQEPEKEFLSTIKKQGQRLFKQGQVLRPEALSLLLYRNALRLAVEEKLVDTARQDGKTLISFPEFREDQRKQMLAHISKFIRVEKYHYLER